MKTFTANEYMAHTLFIQRTERTPDRLPPVLQGILKSPHCSTLLIHSTCLARKRTQAVDFLKSPVTKVLVCRGSLQKWVHLGQKKLAYYAVLPIFAINVTPQIGKIKLLSKILATLEPMMSGSTISKGLGVAAL